MISIQEQIESVLKSIQPTSIFWFFLVIGVQDGSRRGDMVTVQQNERSNEEGEERKGEREEATPSADSRKEPQSKKKKKTKSQEERTEGIVLNTSAEGDVFI